MIGITVLCLLILLIVSLKMNGIGFVNTVNVNTGATTVVGADEVQGTKLADIVTANKNKKRGLPKWRLPYFIQKIGHKA